MVAGPPPIHKIMMLLLSFLSAGAAARSPCQNCIPGTAKVEAVTTCLRKCRRSIPPDMETPFLSCSLSCRLSFAAATLRRGQRRWSSQIIAKTRPTLLVPTLSAWEREGVFLLGPLGVDVAEILGSRDQRQFL